MPEADDASQSPLFIQAYDSMTIYPDGRKISIRYEDVNPYFIYCNACIRSYFWRNPSLQQCPTCQTSLGVKPCAQLISDPTMQGLVDRVYPVHKDEEEEERAEFYHKLGIKRKWNKVLVKNLSMDRVKRISNARRIQFELHPQRRQEGLTLILVLSESSADVSFELPLSFQLGRLRNARMNTESSFKILYLKKFIAKQLQLADFNQIEILCKGIPAGSEYSLDFLARTRWNCADTKLRLEYRRQYR